MRRTSSLPLAGGAAESPRPRTGILVVVASPQERLRVSGSLLLPQLVSGLRVVTAQVQGGDGPVASLCMAQAVGTVGHADVPE